MRAFSLFSQAQSITPAKLSYHGDQSTNRENLSSSVNNTHLKPKASSNPLICYYRNGSKLDPKNDLKAEYVTENMNRGMLCKKPHANMLREYQAQTEFTCQIHISA